MGSEDLLYMLNARTPCGDMSARMWHAQLHAAVAWDTQVEKTPIGTGLALSNASRCLKCNWWLFDTGLHINNLEGRTKLFD